MAIKTHKNHPLYELGTVPLQEGRMPKQDLGNRLVQSYWIELSEGAERKAPLLEQASLSGEAKTGAGVGGDQHDKKRSLML